MKITVLRAIPLVAAVGFVAFLLSGIGRFKNATHGFDYVVGEIVWLGFLACALAFIVLVAVALSRRTMRRHEAVARGAPSEQLREAWCG